VARIAGEVGPRTRRVVYGELGAAEIAAELPVSIQVDRAHVVMLCEQKLISPEAASALLDCMADLEDEGYAPLLGRPAPRGVYLMYEGYLAQRLGDDVGGVLHSGRSRNDLKATITALRLRSWALGYAEEATRLLGVLLSKARTHRDVVMPVHTHFQAAMPITYGHYLLGVAMAVARDLGALRSACEGLAVCPLGASAVAGTDLPIDPSRTAALLGFSSSTKHALDAVASRDVALRVLGAAAGLAVTLSRLGADLQLWSSAEFGFVTFPDRLVGGSSAMPQKRNAFLLEHVKAKPALAIGAWTAAASAMSAKPFTNSIEVGTEALNAIWPGLDAALDTVLLCQVLVSGARPDPARMRERAEDGFVAATAIANRLVQRGVPFRTAHRMVGDAVRRAIEAGSNSLDESFGALDLDTLVRETAYGGGPGAFDAAFEDAVAAWAGLRDWHLAWRRSVLRSAQELSEAVKSLTGVN
jgi:argininosuccinate lyase